MSKYVYKMGVINEKVYLYQKRTPICDYDPSHANGVDSRYLKINDPQIPQTLKNIFSVFNLTPTCMNPSKNIGLQRVDNI